MGISRITALIIATNEVQCEASVNEEGKWAGIISRMENDNYRLLLSTINQYDSKEESVQAMKDTVDSLRESFEKDELT